MLKKHIIGLGLTTAATVASIVLLAPHHIGPPELYPDKSLTPGLVATSDLATLTQTSSCGTYSLCHRQTSTVLKQQIRNEYPNCPTQQEIDHLIPLALGGADDAKNLWCQPLNNEWNNVNYGYKVKDTLETYLVAQMKAGNMSPKDAQQCILQDWVQCYQKYIKPSFGSVDSNSSDVDGDEIE